MSTPPQVFVRPLRDDIALLILRVSVSAMMILHGFKKVTNPDSMAFVRSSLEQVGLPQFISMGVFVGELLAPALVIVGIFTRPAAFIILVNMIFAVGLTQGVDIFSRVATGAWVIELQALFIVALLTTVLMGPGRFSVSKGQGQWWA